MSGNIKTSDKPLATDWSPSGGPKHPKENQQDSKFVSDNAKNNNKETSDRKLSHQLSSFQKYQQITDNKIPEKSIEWA